jgi:hypothetical protein
MATTVWAVALVQQLPVNRKRRLLGEGPVTFYQKNKGTVHTPHHPLVCALTDNSSCDLRAGKKLWLFVLSDALVMSKPKKNTKGASPRPQALSPRPAIQQVRRQRISSAARPHCPVITT